MTCGGDSHTMTHLLLNVLPGALPGRLGADVDGARLALAIVWDPVDRLKETRDRFRIDAFVVVLTNRVRSGHRGLGMAARLWKEAEHVPSLHEDKFPLPGESPLQPGEVFLGEPIRCGVRGGRIFEFKAFN
ncbi:hypothetical protein EYF80_002490 [Liparis tanakae]|uniref:Uncharacterized protein n=1 Tax=Liparis tanakae TaxID=230148 RepID=A0A4Z2JCE5_9TELE|nr:hypothetical protein EYF80_002490 [Liparis tanakae]